jgi:hypothetical protein
VRPREQEPDRQREQQRLAQQEAEVLRRPVRDVLRTAAAVGLLGERGRAVERVQRIARDDPVRPHPDQRPRDGQGGGAQAVAVRRRRPQVEPVEAGQHPRLRAEQSRHREHHEDGDTAAVALRLQQDGADHERGERQVLVADQRVTQEHRP